MLKHKWFVLLIISVTAVLALSAVALAAVSFVQFEAEGGTLSGNATKVTDSTASGGSTVQFNGSTTKVFTHPGVVYTKAEIDDWTTSNPEYTRLANSGAASLSIVPVVFGTRIDAGADDDQNTEINKGMKTQSGYAKIQAMLWAADNNDARRNKVISYLQEYRSVTSYQYDTSHRYRLNSAWGCTNLAQAAEIINYQDDQFKRFLKDVCYPVLDWENGANWHASFADSRLAIAAYLGDQTLWADAKAYFNFRIKQSVYLSSYDGTKVVPIRNEDDITESKDANNTIILPTTFKPFNTSTGTPNLMWTLGQWGGAGTTPQINNDYTFKSTLGAAVDGTNAERTRDLAHVNMSYAAWVNAARTVRAQGEQIERHAYERLLAGWGYHAQRVLSYAQTGTIPSPTAYNGDGGPIRFMGYFSAKKYFGVNTPASINSMVLRPEADDSPAGTLHIIGELLADK